MSQFAYNASALLAATEVRGCVNLTTCGMCNKKQLFFSHNQTYSDVLLITILSGRFIEAVVWCLVQALYEA
jgi:hypothetical protein